MSTNIGLILESLNEARVQDTTGMPVYKSKSKSDELLTTITGTIEDDLWKSLKSQLGWVRCNGSIGMHMADKSINSIEIRVAFDPSKDANAAFELVCQRMEKFIHKADAKPRLSARPGEIIVANNDIKGILLAVEDVYGIKLENFFTKASLKAMKR